MIDNKHAKLVMSFFIFLMIANALIGLVSTLWSNASPIQYAGISFVLMCGYLLSLKYLGWKVYIKPIKEKK